MKKRLILTLLLLCLSVTCFAFVISISNGKSVKADSNWQASSGVTTTTQSGQTVYNTSSGSDAITYTGSLSGKNTLTIDVKYTGNANGWWEYVGIKMGSAEKYYIFGIWPNSNSGANPVLLIQKNTDDPIGYVYRQELGNAVAPNKTFTITAIADSGYFGLYIDGNYIVWNGEIDHAMGTFGLIDMQVVTKDCPSQITVKDVCFTDTNTMLYWNTDSNTSMTNDWYQTNENYSASTFSGSIGSRNTVSAQIKYSAAVDGYGLSGLKLYSGSDYYVFCVFPNTGSGYPPVAFMMHNTIDPINILIRDEFDAAQIGANTFFTIKVVIQSGYFAFYINDTLIGNSSNTGIEVGNFQLDKAEIISYKNATMFRKLCVSYLEPNYSGTLDFDFNTEAGAKAFSVQNGQISWANTSLVLNASGANASITSPEIKVIAGHKYSAKLPVKNTIFARIKNSTNANKLTLYFTTKEETQFSEDKSKTFDITPNSNYISYYFNVSDVHDCGDWISNDRLMSCNHYLKDFKFVFNNTSTGSVSIDAITFEREDRLYETATQNFTCTASVQNGTVTISGTLLQKYAGQKVNVIKTSIKNYNDLLGYSGNSLVATTYANGTSFSVTFPLHHGEMTHLSSWFLASVGENYQTGTSFGKMFQIENWRDFSSNPYAFTIRDVSVTAKQYGAKGDGVTNDDVALQNAIDYLYSKGGGKLILEGDTSNPYGNRYCTTGIELKSNVELVIEKGATLLQSQRIPEYTKYTLYLNHDDMGSAPVPWGFSGLMHYPLIYIHDATNVKVTGGGEIRMADPGSEWLDGNGYTWDSKIHVGCSSYPTLIPIGIYAVSNVEISDVTISRSGGWHIYTRETDRGYYANINMTEMNCINTDGFDFSTAVHDILVERNSLYSNDDALTLCITTSDPRDDYSIWRERSTKDDVSVYNFEIRYNHIYGGHGITFIPWASGYANFGKAEIYNIKVYDNCIGGYATAVGDWQDNPFYGESNVSNYTQAEDNDYSPIRDIYICNNEYDGPTLLSTGTGFTAVQKATNFISDCGIYSSDKFINGNFDKTLRYDGEKDWTTGLSNWSRIGNVGTEKVGTKQAVSAKSGTTFTINDYAGYIKGSGELYQGLYKTKGYYKFSLKIKCAQGTATIFARSSSGEIIAKKVFSGSSSFVTETLDFSLLGNLTVQLGVSFSGTDSQYCYIDDATVSSISGSGYDYSVAGKVLPINAEANLFNVYSLGSSVTFNNGYISTDGLSEYKIMLNSAVALRTAEISVDIKINGTVNAGLYLLASNVYNNPDDISAYNVQVESQNANYIVSIFRFDGRFVARLAQSSEFSESGKITLKVVIKNDNILAFVNGGSSPVAVCEIADNLKSGSVGLRAQYTSAQFTSFTVKTDKNLSIYGDKTQLNALLELSAESYAHSERYITNTYTAFYNAYVSAQNLADNVYQAEIDSVYSTLLTAYNSLALRGDKTQLNALLTIAKAKVQASYTTATYNALQTAIQSAESLSVDATQSQVDTAYNNLNTAINNLVLRGDKTALNELLTLAKAVQSGVYTQDSYNALQSAIEQAEGLGIDATQEEVNAKYQALSTAYNGLEEIVIYESDSSEEISESISDSQATITTDSEQESISSVDNSESSQSEISESAQSEISDDSQSETAESSESEISESEQSATDISASSQSGRTRAKGCGGSINAFPFAFLLIIALAFVKKYVFNK